MLRQGWHGVKIGLMCAAFFGGSLQAQTGDPMAAPATASPIYSLDQEALFEGSQFGIALRAALGEESAKVEAESRRLDSELEAEERALTQKRAELPPEDFAPLAAAFDEKVRRLRAEREAAANDLRAREVAGRQRFFEAAAQVIGDYMIEKGAVAIIDKSVIIVSLTSLDVTREVIQRLDAVLDAKALIAP